jgi:hypothetical protein
MFLSLLPMTKESFFVPHIYDMNAFTQHKISCPYALETICINNARFHYNNLSPQKLYFHLLQAPTLKGLGDHPITDNHYKNKQKDEQCAYERHN